MENKIKKLFSLISIILFCSIINFAQKANSQTANQEPVIVPLTNEEKAINLKDLLINQPAFTAVQSFFFSEGFGGFSVSQKIAAKDNLYRIDTGVVTVITELNKPNIRLFQNKTYETEIGDQEPFITPSVSLNPKDLLGFEDLSLTALGTIEIDKHKCLKIEAKSKSFSLKVFLYAAMDLKNLIIVAQVIDERQGSIQRLQQISFDVPDSLFKVPSDYKELPKYKWEKIANAKILKGKKVIADIIVFRYNDYIFIHADEFEDYLVDLKKQTSASSVFQGLLVTDKGQYVWRTKAVEAFSIGELKIYFDKSNCKKCPKVVVGSNYVIFPGENYDNNKGLIKLSW